jgi:hypothetical protein
LIVGDDRTRLTDEALARATKGAMKAPRRLLFAGIVLTLAILSVLTALSCDGDDGDESAPTATPSGSTTAPTATLVPADSEGPAAGACDPQPDSDVVTFTLQPDIPSPRCAQVTADQHLSLTNGTGQSVTVTYAGRTLTIADGATEEINEPFGTYLALGVHVAHVDFYAGSGPEIWLQP